MAKREGSEKFVAEILVYVILLNSVLQMENLKIIKGPETIIFLYAVAMYTQIPLHCCMTVDKI